MLPPLDRTTIRLPAAPQHSMRTLLLALLLLALASRHLLAAEPAKPNLLILLADDLGYADVGFNGGTAVLNNLRVTKAGTYRFRITINGLTLTKTLVIRGRRSSSSA